MLHYQVVFHFPPLDLIGTVIRSLISLFLFMYAIWFFRARNKGITAVSNSTWAMVNSFILIPKLVKRDEIEKKYKDTPYEIMPPYRVLFISILFFLAAIFVFLFSFIELLPIS